MSLTSHLLALFCVALIALGQLLFKYTANAWRLAGTFYDSLVIVPAFSALTIYGCATLLWIVVLQDAPLSRVYPYMALSFVLVALASWLVLREQIPLGQVAGLALVLGGLLVIALS